MTGCYGKSPKMKILIIRLSAIGDVIFASGLIPALRSLYPDARIAWLTEDCNADLLRHHPRLDRLYLWPRRRWGDLCRQGRYRKLIGESSGLIRALRAERFDLVLDLQGLLKSGLWAWLSGGRRRIGLGSREGSRLLMTETVSRRVDSPLMSKEYRKLAEVLGAEPGAFTLDIAVSAVDRESATALLRDHGVSGSYAIIAPFTTRPQKHWPDQYWVELAHRMVEETRLPLLMLGGPGDRERAAKIFTHPPDGLIDLTGQTTIGQCAALIERAKLLIGVDTGLTHLGIALDTPTLALFGSTRPYLETGRVHAEVLYEPLACSPCRRRPTCGGTFECMKLHTVPKVYLAAKKLLEKASSSRPSSMLSVQDYQRS
jgi:heptosyltransferase-1